MLFEYMGFNWTILNMSIESCVDPEWGTGGLNPPGKSQLEDLKVLRRSPDLEDFLIMLK